MDLCQKKQEHLNPDDPSDIGDAWIWRAIALPSHLRVITHLSYDRSEEEAITFLAAFKARTKSKHKRLAQNTLSDTSVSATKLMVERESCAKPYLTGYSPG